MPEVNFWAAPIDRHWREEPRASTLKLHVNRVIIHRSYSSYESHAAAD